MKRRTFLKATGLIAAGQVLPAWPLARPADAVLVQPAPPPGLDLAPSPSAAAPTIDQPGLYQISGLVRLEAPLVEISGIAHNQSISWSGGEASGAPVASFVSFERFDRPGVQPDIRVEGGRLEALSAVLLD